MSLFKAKEWWSSGTVISEEDLELFNVRCIKTSQLGVEGSGDNIIIGNLNGLIQIFKPYDFYQPTHVILECIMDEPILQVDSGKLVFGSEEENIAILHPKSIAVFSLLTKEGQADFGNQSVLSEQYRHALPRTAFNFILGGFGGVKDKDFICVQSLDGLLMFFEQDVATFTCYLPEALLPNSIAFSQCTDSFVVCSSNWMIESYSYHSLSQTSESNEGKLSTGKKISADWIYNIGESINIIHKIQTSSHSCSLVILGNKSLYCLSDNGTLKFMKQFDFDIVCSHAYLIGWFYDPSSRLMIMVVSETSTLLIYEQTTLLWSCQLTFFPLFIGRGFFSFLPGSIVSVTDCGEVKCLYLGTEPELFTAPPMVESNIDFEAVQQELEKIQNTINNQYDVGEITLINKACEREMPFHINISRKYDLNNHPHDVNIDHDETREVTSNVLKCSVELQLKPLNKSEIELLQVTFIVQSPLKCSNPLETFYQITDNVLVKTDVFVNHSYPLSRCDLIVAVLFTSTLGNVRVLKKQVSLPFGFLVQPVRPIKESKFKVTLTTDKPQVDLLDLFKDFETSLFHEVSASSNVVAFENIIPCDSPVTIISAKSSQRYRLQSDGLATMRIVLLELVNRLRVHYTKKTLSYLEEDKKSINIMLYGGVSNDIIQYFITNIEKHLALRQKLFEAEKTLDTLSCQFILIQKRLMIKYREKPPTSCDGVHFLLKDTNKRMHITTQSIMDFRKKLLQCGLELSGCVNMIVTLLRILDTKNEVADLIEFAFLPGVLHHEKQDWEETVAQNVLYLLKEKFSKNDKDRDKLVPFNQEENVKDFDVKKFVKYVRLLIERVLSKHAKSEECLEPEAEHADDTIQGESQQLDTVEEEKSESLKENMLQVPEGSLLGFYRKPILTARWEKQQNNNNS